MAWSQDEERVLAQIERHLVDDDPRLASRLESFNERVQRKENRQNSARERETRGSGGRLRRPRRSTVVIMVSWLVIAVLISALLVLVLRPEMAAALPL
ncbi:hypothetical protein Misp01_16400 [Microtetraspora sp. NBRC 13810]|uniref:DUF3040 domain-containing protein n=1 Tax=Microtetraspora sp. NBRC 13810 TaxID=3030990 RepID=UPI0024A3A8BB|nr:DUF3040 domain-containing protein [Microtetraspora sp. NBRC 13810]GLW06510.1 hypothetical protein Misp01_16400 [Microtetraspora sp. NBRC 13810]